MKNVLQWLKVWWENRKSVVLDFVLPKLDLLLIPLTDLLVSKGIPKVTSAAIAGEVIGFIKDYLRRQL
jgi:hypothetical protein